MSVFMLTSACGLTAWTTAGSMRGLHAAQPQRSAVRMGAGEYAMGLGDDNVERKSPVEKLALNVKGLSEEERSKIYDVADTLFNVVDRNGDEFISKEELASHLLLARYSEESVEALFDLIDINSDGSVSRAELRDSFVKHPSLRGSPAMGVLSKSKRAAIHEEADETFTRLDLDGNGRLSLAELESHFASREGPSFSAAAVANIFRTLTVGGDVKEEVTRSEFRGAFVRYRAMRLALGLRSAVSDA